MKYLFLTIFFLASFAVIACGQIVFPSPNQVEMQKGYLTLRKKISRYHNFLFKSFPYRSTS